MAALPLACDMGVISSKGTGAEGGLSLQGRRTPWSDARSSGVQIDTQHYRIYTTSHNEPLLSVLPGFMEASFANYQSISGLDGGPAPGPAVSYIMGTRQEWADLTEAKFGKNAPMLGIESGGYCHDRVCVLWDMGGLGTLATAAHEGMHQFLAYRMKQQLPMWLEEGICTLTEGYEISKGRVTFTPGKNVMRFGALRRVLMTNQWTPTAKLLPMDAGDVVGKQAQDAVGYYGQLWALSLLLRTDARYRQGLENLMRDAQEGKLAAAAGMTPEQFELLARQGRAYNRIVSDKLFRQYISSDLDAFERRYKAFAQELAKIR